MTETITITWTLPVSIYTTTLDSGFVLTTQNTMTMGDVIIIRLLVALIAVVVLDFTFRLVYRR